MNPRPGLRNGLRLLLPLIIFLLLGFITANAQEPSPRLCLDQSSFDFGTVYVGASKVLKLYVRNCGDAVLDKLEIYLTGAPNYQILPTYPFRLSVGESHPIWITFEPQLPRELSGILLLSSPQLDPQLIQVPLRGAGYLAPRARVEIPNQSLHVDEGDTLLVEMRVSNTGDTPLYWNTRLRLPPADASHPLADLSGKTIAWFDRITQGPWYGIPQDTGEFRQDLEERGARIRLIGGHLGDSDLRDSDLLVYAGHDTGNGWDSEDLHRVIDWIHEGGFFVGQTFGASDLDWLNELLEGLGRVERIVPGSHCTDVLAISAGLADLADDVNTVYWRKGNSIDGIQNDVQTVLAQCSGSKPRAILIRSWEGLALIIAADVLGDDLTWTRKYRGYPDDDYYFVRTQNQFFRQRLVDWLLPSTRGLVGPRSGLLDYGRSTIVSWKISARDEKIGNQPFFFRVGTSDPRQPWLDERFYAEIRARPLWSADPDTLHYQEVPVGLKVSKSLRLENVGRAGGNYEIVPGPSGELAISKAKGYLGPAESVEVPISWTPASTGPWSDSLFIRTTDFVRPDLPLTADGTGILKPIILVSPPSLSSTLYMGDTDEHELTISNAGTTPLHWSSKFIPVAPIAKRSFSLPPIPSKDEKVQGAQDIAARDVEMVLADLSGMVVQLQPLYVSYPYVDNEWVPLCLDGCYLLDLQRDLLVRGATVGDKTHVVPQPDVIVEDRFSRSVESQLRAGKSGLLCDEVGYLSSDDWGGPPPINTFFEEMGSSIRAVESEGSLSEAMQVVGHTATEGVEKVVLKKTMTFDPGTDAVLPLLLDQEGRIVAFEARLSAGRLVCIGATDFLGLYGETGNRRLANQIFDLFAGADWASANEEGVVEPAASQEISVRFDTHGLPAQHYEGLLRLSNDDPDHPRLDLPLSLDVLSSADLVVNEEVLDFGWAGAGVITTAVMHLENRGQSALTVLEITSPDSQLVFPEMPVEIPAGGRVEVSVGLRPRATGSFSSSLKIVTDQARQPFIELPVTAMVTDPAVMKLENQEQSLTLWSGQGARPRIGLSNKGQAVLAYRLVRQSIPRGPGETADLRGLRMLYDPRNADTVFMAAFLDQLRQEGVEAVGIQSGLIDSLAVGGWDLVWLTNPPFRGRQLTDEEVAFLSQWVRQGGRLIVEGMTLRWHMSKLRDALGLGVRLQGETRGPGEAVPVSDHEILQGIDRVRIGGGYVLGPISGEATVLTRDPEGNPHLAVQEVGLGRVFFTGDHVFGGLGDADSTQLALARRVVDWVSDSWWLSSKQFQGSLPGGRSQEIELAVDAWALSTRSIDEFLRIESNSAAPDTATIHLHLDIEPGGILMMPTTPIDFGFVRQGDTVSRTLSIRNPGTAELRIDQITFDREEFHSESSSLTIPPAGRLDLPILYTAGSGKVNGHLELTTSSMPFARVRVQLTGKWVPRFEIEPDSLVFDLVPGDTLREKLLLTNPGSQDEGYSWWPVSLDPGRNEGFMPNPMPRAGRLAPGAQDTSRVTLIAPGWSPGSYHDLLEVHLDGSAALPPLAFLPVTMHLGSSPWLTAGAESIDFGTVYIEGGETQQWLELHNRGNELLEIQDCRVDSTLFRLDKSSATLDPGDSTQLRLTFTPAEAGTLQSMLRIDSNDPRSPLQIPLRAIVRHRPLLEISGDGTVDLATVPGHMARRELTLYNRGMADLDLSFHPKWEDSRLLLSPDSAVVAPGDSMSLAVWGDARSVDQPTRPSRMYFEIESNDPDPAVTSMTVLLNTYFTGVDWLEIVPNPLPRVPGQDPVEFRVQLPTESADAVIDPSTVLLDDTLSPLDSSIPLGDRNGDGVNDFTLHFSSDELLALLGQDGEHEVGIIGAIQNDYAFEARGILGVGGASAKHAAAALHFTLETNRPNPFSAGTTIRFSLARPREVKLKIYDLRGRCVRSLVEGPLASGVYRRDWDGKDNTGRAVASGVYFYRLEAGSFSATKRMVLRR